MDRETAMEEEEGKTSSSPLLCASSSVAMSNPKFANASQMCGDEFHTRAIETAGKKCRVSKRVLLAIVHTDMEEPCVRIENARSFVKSTLAHRVHAHSTYWRHKRIRSLCNPCSFRNDQQI